MRCVLFGLACAYSLLSIFAAENPSAARAALLRNVGAIDSGGLPGHDQWATRLSRITGQNIAAVFDAWNIPLSDTARQACAKYPRPAAADLFAGL